MNNVTKRLTRHQAGMTAKNRHLLNQFEAKTIVAKFLNFPFEGLDRLLDGRELSHHEAVEAQIYIAI